MKEGSKKEREKERETNSINYIKNDGKKIGKKRVKDCTKFNSLPLIKMLRDVNTFNHKQGIIYRSRYVKNGRTIAREA